MSMAAHTDEVFERRGLPTSDGPHARRGRPTGRNSWRTRARSHDDRQPVRGPLAGPTHRGPVATADRSRNEPPNRTSCRRPPHVTLNPVARWTHDDRSSRFAPDPADLFVDVLRDDFHPFAISTHRPRRSLAAHSKDPSLASLCAGTHDHPGGLARRRRTGSCDRSLRSDCSASTAAAAACVPAVRRERRPGARWEVPDVGSAS